MAKPLPLPVWDRQRGKLVEEWMDDHQPHYESEPQRSLTQWIKSQPLYDRLYALYENSRWSTREIEPFIRKYHIDMAEFEPVQYRSFAEFFDRRFRQGVRKFPSAPKEMGAFAEARYFGWKRVERDQTFPVKGHSLSPRQIRCTSLIDRTRCSPPSPSRQGLSPWCTPPMILAQSRKLQPMGSLKRAMMCASITGPAFVICFGRKLWPVSLVGQKRRPKMLRPRNAR